ncbi:MAG: FliA/WhiG family RNA polymerase sigma factor [Desulfuromonadia bacterium]
MSRVTGSMPKEEPPTFRENRDEMIIAHMPMVRYLVNKIASQLPPHLDREDLMSAAVIGLITAAERFDPSRGVQFKTFVEQRIRGTIMDELRAQDWLTRSVRDKYKRLEREFSRLEQKLGRNPTSEEVAEAMEMELTEYFNLLEEVHFLSVVSLDDSWEDEDGSPFGLLDVLEDKGAENPQQQMLNREMVGLMADAIETLPEKERIVITLYYFEDMNLKEIGGVLSLTESRICQLHSQAVVRLRSKMRNMA